MSRLVNLVKNLRCGPPMVCQQVVQMRKYTPVPTLPPVEFIDIDMDTMDGAHVEEKEPHLEEQGQSAVKTEDKQSEELWEGSIGDDGVPDGWFVDGTGRIMPHEDTYNEEN